MHHNGTPAKTRDADKSKKTRAAIAKRQAQALPNGRYRQLFDRFTQQTAKELRHGCLAVCLLSGDPQQVNVL